jgi:hypothetical protein
MRVATIARLLAVGLVFVALPAMADPVSLIASAIGYLFPAVAAYATAIATGILVAVGIGMADRARKKARDARNQSLRDRVITVRGATEPRRMVLGRCRVGGVAAFHGSTGPNKEQFVMVVALAAHEVDAIEEVWFNDQKLTLGGTNNEWVQTAPWAITQPDSYSELFVGDSTTTVFNLQRAPIAGSVSAGWNSGGGEGGNWVVFGIAGVTGTAVTLDTAPGAGVSFTIDYQANVTTSYARVRSFLGASGQTVDSVVSALFPGQWDSTHPLSGCAGLACFFYYSEEAYVSGLPNVSAVVRGAKVYDPRKDSTAGGSGSHRVNTSTTWEFSESPPLLIAHYARHQLGGRLASTNIKYADVAVAAEVGDTLVNYANWAGLVNENGYLITTETGDVILAGSTGAETDLLYTAGIVARTDQRPLDVINELAEAMAGRVAFVGNQLIMRAGQYVAPVLSLGDDDFAGGSVSVQRDVPRDSLFNTVTARFIDQAQDWKEIDMPRVTASAYVTADGGIELPMEVQYGAINRAGQAQQVSAVILRQARQALTVVARFRMTAYPLELFDTVALTNTHYGWVAKPFEVLGRKWSLDGLIELTLRETDPSIYGFGNVFDDVDAAPNTNLTLPHQIPQLTGLTLESGTAALSDGSIITRTRITWDASTDQSVLQGGKVEIQYYDTIDPFPTADWPSTTGEGSSVETTVVGLKGGRTYIVRGRFVGASGRVRGPWSLQVTHTVAVPPRVGGQNLFINASFEVDTANVADNWTVYTTGTTGSVTHSDGAGIFGSRAQRVDLTNLGTSANDRAGYFQEVNVSGFIGRSMTLSVYAEGTANAKVRLYVDLYAPTGGGIVGSSQVTHTLSTTVQRFTLTFPVVDGSAFAGCFFWIEQRPSASGAAYLRIDAAQLEEGSTATAFATTADEAMAVAAAAVATANAASTNANAALATLATIASDSILSPGEKPAAVLDYNTLIGEQGGIDDQAVAFASTAVTAAKNAYDTAISDLTTYLGTLTGWNTIPGTDVAIVGTTWRSKWGAAYLTRTVVLNAIAAETALRASWVSVTGRPKVYRAISKGLDAINAGNGPTPIGLSDGESGAVLASNGRSYTVIRIRRSDRVITLSQTYDVYASSANATSMAAVLNATDHTYVVVVMGYDEPQTNRLSNGLLAAMLRCGASVGVFGSPQFKTRAAYILIGIGGCGPSNGAEFYQGETDSDANAWTEATFMITAEGNLVVTGSAAIPRTLTDYGAGGLAYLSTVNTAQLEPEATTTILIGAKDTATYGGGFTSPLPGALNVTPDVNCVMRIRGIADLIATNSSGSAKVIRAIAFIQVTGESPTGSGGTWRRSIANGETWQTSVNVESKFDALGGLTYEIGMFYSDHVSATQQTTLTNIQLFVELIKR